MLAILADNVHYYYYNGETIEHYVGYVQSPVLETASYGRFYVNDNKDKHFVVSLHKGRVYNNGVWLIDENIDLAKTALMEDIKKKLCKVRKVTWDFHRDLDKIRNA